MTALRKARLRRTIGGLGIAFGLFLGVLRFFGLFGSVEYLDGAFVAIVLIEAASLLIFPFDLIRKDRDG